MLPPTSAQNGDIKLTNASECGGCRDVSRRDQFIFAVELKQKGRYVKEYSKAVSDGSSYSGADPEPVR